ncbi:MAG: hypothetical protein F4201_09700, partial [Nitrospira sp. SB0677_bin_15]|nr:hypothetical protein [Nitrospira sp. SB0677_bin_15]
PLSSHYSSRRSRLLFFSSRLGAGIEMVLPADNTTFTGELIAPIAMEQGLRFAVREGGRTVGAGVVTEILA